MNPRLFGCPCLVALVGCERPSVPVTVTPPTTAPKPQRRVPVVVRGTVRDGDGEPVRDAFVFIKKGAFKDASPGVLSPVVLALDDGAYQPRVIGVRVGQILQILCRGTELHSPHALYGPLMRTTPWKTDEIWEYTFTHAEVMIKIKCDVHGGEIAYVGVVNHPGFAVTDAGGRFELRFEATGDFTLEAWREDEPAVRLIMALEEGRTEYEVDFK